MNNVLQKTKSNTFEDIAVKRHYNSTNNQLGVITHLELFIEVLQVFSSF
jgi:hypothetical protein